MQKTKLVPKQVCQFLVYPVRWRFDKALTNRKPVMPEVSDVERSIPNTLGREVRTAGVKAVGAHEAAGRQTAPLVANSGRGTKRGPGEPKRKPVSESAGPSVKACQSCGAVHKGNAESSHSKDSSNYEPSSGVSSPSDSED